MFLTIILIIAFIWYISDNNKKMEKLRKENLLLKKEIDKLKNPSNLDENVVSTNQEVNQVVNQTQVVETNVIKKEKTKEEKLREEKEKKNTSILITGAILIVLAAIVFLTSTWNAIPNIIKTLVIILLVGVFLGASKIAKEKNLQKTSSTFFYMAMAYIPICLISCSIFSLFGEYLSIYGDGNYIYLTLCGIFTSIIYFINYRKTKSIGLICASIISQISSVILFTLIFEESMQLILINLLIYNIALMLLSQGKNLEFIKNAYKAISYISGFLTLIYFSFIESGIVMLALTILLAVNFLILYRKNENIVLNSYLFNFSIYFFGLFTLINNISILNENITLLIEAGYILAIFAFEKLFLKSDENKQLLKSSMVMSIIFMGLVFIESTKYSDILVKPFMIAIVEEVLLVLAYIGSKEKGKEICSYLIPCCFIVIGCNFISEVKNVYHFYIVFSILVFLLGEIIKSERINKSTFIISHIFMASVYVTFLFYEYENFSDDVIYFIMLLCVHMYSFIKHRNLRIFKYFSYIAGTMCLYSGVAFLDLNTTVTLLVPFLVAVLIRILEANYEELKDDYSNIFITIFEIISYISVMAISSDSRIAVALIFTLYMFGISIYKRKVSLATISSGVYLCATLNLLENDLIKEILWLCWSGIHLFAFDDDKAKDVFKGILYIAGWCLYNSILSELGLDLEYNAFYMIGVTILAVISTKTIIYKYVKKIDNLEYVLFSLIYFCCLVSYLNEKDGMLYVFALVCLLLVSYIQKYGAIFVVTTIAILVNALALTREFWFSIPWWIYLLLLGTILISFAIKNESNDNKEKISVGKIIKKVKDNIEK